MSSAAPSGPSVVAAGVVDPPAEPGPGALPAFDLEDGVCPVCRPAPSAHPPAVTSPEAAAGLLLPALAGADRERCVALLLDTRHRLLEARTISVGSVDHTFMSPREIFRDALLANASALVLGHNHPSGDPEPSSDDEAVTRRVAAAGEQIGVRVLDHLVVGDGWVSLARRGCLDGSRRGATSG